MRTREAKLEGKIFEIFVSKIAQKLGQKRGIFRDILTAFKSVIEANFRLNFYRFYINFTLLKNEYYLPFRI